MKSQAILFKGGAKKCPKCQSELKNAPGIGLYCPNKQCEKLDDIEGFENIIKSTTDRAISDMTPDERAKSEKHQRR